MTNLSQQSIDHCKKHASRKCCTCPFVGAYCTSPTNIYPSELYDKWIAAKNKNIASLYAE